MNTFISKRVKVKIAEGVCHESLHANDRTKADILGRSFLSGCWGSGLMAVGLQLGQATNYLNST